MGQHLFSKPCSDDTEYRNHKENLIVGGNPLSHQSLEESPPNKRRRIFPPTINLVNNSLSLPSHHNPNVYCSSTRLHRRKFRSKSNASVSLSLEKTIRSKPLPVEKSERTKHNERKSLSYHELRSTNKCQWIREGLWTASASEFNPPPFPVKVFPANTHPISAHVEVPCFRRNPIELGKVRAKKKLSEEISDNEFNKRHRKFEELEKKIVRWDRQRQRELQYYEYLKQKDAKRKTAQWVPNAVTPKNGYNSPHPCPTSATEIVHPRNCVNEDSLWPPLESIQFIEILSSNTDPVYITMFGQPLPAVNLKAGFSLPWAVDPSTEVSASPFKTKVKPSTRKRLGQLRLTADRRMAVRLTKIKPALSSVAQKNSIAAISAEKNRKSKSGVLQFSKSSSPSMRLRQSSSPLRRSLRSRQI